MKAILSIKNYYKPYFLSILEYWSIIELNSFSVKSGHKVSVKKKYLAFSGLGNNVKFFNTLKNANYNIALTKEFQDHHNYKENEIIDLIKIANENNLKLITTEKDIVKIPKKYHLKINCLKMKIKFDKKDLISLKSLLLKKLNDWPIIF